MVPLWRLCKSWRTPRKQWTSSYRHRRLRWLLRLLKWSLHMLRIDYILWRSRNGGNRIQSKLLLNSKLMGNKLGSKWRCLDHKRLQQQLQIMQIQLLRSHSMIFISYVLLNIIKSSIFINNRLLLMFFLICELKINLLWKTVIKYLYHYEDSFLIFAKKKKTYYFLSPFFLWTPFIKPQLPSALLYIISFNITAIQLKQNINHEAYSHSHTFCDSRTWKPHLRTWWLQRLSIVENQAWKDICWWSRR